MTDWAKWKLVPVEPPQSLIDEACHEHDPGVMCWAKLNFAERWKRVLTTAPSAPIVDVSRDSCRDVYAVYEQNNGDDGNRVYSGRRMIAAVQQVLGPQLGMVTRDELSRAVEAAFLEGYRSGREPTASDGHCDWTWRHSDAKRVLGGVE